jgi:hypothetical protein
MEVVQQGVVVGIGKYRDNTIQYEYHTCRRRWPEGEKAGIPNKPEFRRLHLLVAACFLPVNLLPASPSRSFRYHCYYYLPLLDLKESTYCTLRSFLPSLPWPLHAPSHSCLPPLPPLPPPKEKGPLRYTLFVKVRLPFGSSLLFLHPVIAFLIGPPHYTSQTLWTCTITRHPSANSPALHAFPPTSPCAGISLHGLFHLSRHNLAASVPLDHLLMALR